MNIAEYIDHTLLKPDANLENILQVCTEAQEFCFAAVCIPPFYVNSAFRALESGKQKVQIATVVGFPLGYSSTAAKVEEVKRALEDGADEIDAVINLCAIKSQSWAHVRNDLDSMVMATRMRGKKIKIILETALLTPHELEQACAILAELKPDFAKTSTGFNGGGATVEVVRQMGELLEHKIAIKASGGIRNASDARAMIEAGATRIGTSSGIAIVKGENGTAGY
jgi:deoxyribose-phosphate aldolase